MPSVPRIRRTRRESVGLGPPAGEPRLTELHAEGLTFLVVEHDMNVVMSLCDPVIVLDRGATIANIYCDHRSRLASCGNVHSTWFRGVA